MSRTISPLRRIVAVAALAGVTGIGAVAAAPAALAYQTDGTDVSAPATDPGTPATDPAAPTDPAPADVSGPGDVSADVSGPADATPAPAASSFIRSPMPDKPITVTLGRMHFKLSGIAAQLYQTVQANLYARQGYQVSFDEHGVLIVGDKICNPAKSAAWNTGCVLPSGPRF